MILEVMPAPQYVMILLAALCHHKAPSWGTVVFCSRIMSAATWETDLISKLFIYIYIYLGKQCCPDGCSCELPDQVVPRLARIFLKALQEGVF